MRRLNIFCQPKHCKSGGPDGSSEFYDGAVMYGVFFGAWMNGYSLDDCISMASKEYPFAPVDMSVHLNWTFNQKYGGLYSLFPYLNKFDPYIYGYPGITRNGYEPGHDNSKYQP